MAETMFDRLRRRVAGPQGQVRTSAPLPAPRPLIELGPCWPWLALIFIMWMHPGWTSDQIAQLLAAFTPYILLAKQHRGA